MNEGRIICWLALLVGVMALLMLEAYHPHKWKMPTDIKCFVVEDNGKREITCP